ncbi:hypothetical protein BDV09DRAFT_178246 [Aspergillus tetrazonus]
MWLLLYIAYCSGRGCSGGHIRGHLCASSNTIGVIPCTFSVIFLCFFLCIFCIFFCIFSVYFCTLVIAVDAGPPS